MKKLLMTITLALGLILFAMPAFTDPTGSVDATEASTIEIEPDAIRACPNCTGDAPIITGVTFQTGSNCTCSGTTSLTIGPNVTVENGAIVSFTSPRIIIKSGTRFEPGSVVNMRWIKEPISIDLTAAPTSIAADGSSYSIITAVFKDGDVNPVPEGTSVNFTTTLGTFPNDAQAYTIQTYDNTGIVTVFLHSGITAGTATVAATLGGTTEQVQVTISSKAPATIALQADPNSLNADGVSTSTIRASVADATGSSVPDGTTVSFSVTTGTGILSAASATTIGGVATVTYTASTTGDIETIKAETSNGVTASTDITLIGVPDPADFSLSTDRTSIKSDDSESATITATVVDGNNASFPGAIISFSADSGIIKAPSDVTTDGNGRASITISSGTLNKSNRVITITATVATIGAQTIPVQVVGSTLTASTDRTTITDDDTTVAKLTITAKDAGNVGVYNAQITFSFDPNDTGTATITPVIPATYPYTDVSGKLEVIITGETAGSVTVIANGLGTTATQVYTVSEVGTEFTIVLPSSDPFSAQIRTVGTFGTLATTPDNTSIAFVESPKSITRSDGGDFTADKYVVGNRIMVGGSSDNDGAYTVNGVTANTLTLISSDTLTAEATGESVTITNGVLVRVRAEDQTTVSFSSTIGVWDGGSSAIVSKPVPATDYVWSILTSDSAGSATVQVYDTDDTTTTENTTIAFSAPSGDAAKLNLQASRYVVAPSTGDIPNTATLSATVKSAAGAVVGNAPVVFSIKGSTGGGETVSPVVVLTNSSGIATSTFTSGSLSTGAEGVEITATVLDEGQTVAKTSIAFEDNYPSPCTITRDDALGSFIDDGFAAGDEIRVSGSIGNDGYYLLSSVASSVAPKTLTLNSSERLNEESKGSSVTIIAATSSVNIVIGGTAGSVVIGRGSIVYEVNDATYRVPMSVLVADSNGNPVSGAIVSLSAWPAHYSAGVWYDRNANGTVRNFDTYLTRTSINEDLNENMILDPGEDTNGDGELTPRNSAAGDVPTTVTTDSNGVAIFDLIYLKNSAVWIYDRIRASTQVIGSEITSSLEFRLPYIADEGEAGDLPDSPYPIYLLTDTTTPKDITFPPLGVNTQNNPDLFSTTYPLTAGTSTVLAHKYTYDPTGVPPAKVGDIVQDWITVKGSSYDWEFYVGDDLTAYFQVRIAIRNGEVTGTTVDLTATPPEITADGSSKTSIRASVTDSQGEPVADGTNVDFTKTLGTLSSTSASTISGLATVTLTSGTVTGISTVTATTDDGASDSTEVKFLAGPVDTVTVSAAPDTVQADGISECKIEAKAEDANGNPVSGHELSFSVVSGKLSDSTAVTDGNGIATVTYIAPISVPGGGTDTVTSTSENAKFGNVNITIIAVPVQSVAVTAGSSSIVADGSDSTVIRATVKNTAGNNVDDGTTVNFTTTAGSLSSATATILNGIATVTLTSGTNLGTATVKATCEGVNGNTSVDFIAGPVASVDVTAIPNNLSADGTSTSTITATATDANNNVIASETISFTVVSGSLSAASAVSNASGVATVTYTAPYSVPAGNTDTVTAESTNSSTDTSTITIIPNTVGSIQVASEVDEILADGASSTDIIATVKDEGGLPVPDGTTVNFGTTAGTLTGGGSTATATTTDGVATVVLTSSTVRGDATVTATCGGLVAQTTVTFLAGEPAAGNIFIKAIPNSVSFAVNDKSTITVEVFDANDNPVEDGTTLNFSVDDGVLDKLVATTTDGAATVNYTAPGPVPVLANDTVTVTATNGEDASVTIDNSDIP